MKLKKQRVVLWVSIFFASLITISYFLEFKEGFTDKKNKDKDTNTNIPKSIYMCDKTLEYIQKYSKNWGKINPDYKIKLYDNQMCKKFLLEEYSQLHLNIFDFIKDGPIKADFWRCCILYKYGGVYVDADIEPLEPINFIPEDVDFVTCLSQYSNHLFNPHFIMAKPNDTFLKKCIDKYISFYNNNKIYTYWGWSIVTVLDSIMETMYKINVTKDGIYTIDDKKCLFLKEVYGKNYQDNHCVYKSKRVLNNRYKNYDFEKHAFKETKIEK